MWVILTTKALTLNLKTLKCDEPWPSITKFMLSPNLASYYHQASFANFVAAASNLEIIPKFKL